MRKLVKTAIIATAGYVALSLSNPIADLVQKIFSNPNVNNTPIVEIAKQDTSETENYNGKLRVVLVSGAPFAQYIRFARIREELANKGSLERILNSTESTPKQSLLHQAASYDWNQVCEDDRIRFLRDITRFEQSLDRSMPSDAEVHKLPYNPKNGRDNYDSTMSVLKEISSEATSDDTLLFVYSGHGSPGGGSLLIGNNEKYPGNQSYCLSPEVLCDIAEHTKGRKIFILSSCGAGVNTEELKKENLEKTTIITITSQKGFGYAYFAGNPEEANMNFIPSLADSLNPKGDLLKAFKTAAEVYNQRVRQKRDFDGGAPAFYSTAKSHDL